jgi:molybdopterin-binding protein
VDVAGFKAREIYRPREGFNGTVKEFQIGKGNAQVVVDIGW